LTKDNKYCRTRKKSNSEKDQEHQKPGSKMIVSIPTYGLKIKNHLIFFNQMTYPQAQK
jgi:hypothetical protein